MTDQIPTMCFEARVPVEFVELARAAIAKAGAR